MAGAGFSVADAERWIPRLRRYALALTGNREAAEVLKQTSLERAWCVGS
jgi:DNA-directed RNA polymerase specialized sigma24 family protein